MLDYMSKATNWAVNSYLRKVSLKDYLRTSKVILSLHLFEKHAEEAKQQEEEKNAQTSDSGRVQMTSLWERPRRRPRKRKKYR